MIYSLSWEIAQAMQYMHRNIAVRSAREKKYGAPFRLSRSSCEKSRNILFFFFPFSYIIENRIFIIDNRILSDWAPTRRVQEWGYKLEISARWNWLTRQFQNTTPGPTTQSMPVALSMAKLETQLQVFCRFKALLKLLINLPFSSRFNRFSPPHLVIYVSSVKSILKNYSFGEFVELVVNRSMWSFNFINAILLKMMKSDCK